MSISRKIKSVLRPLYHYTKGVGTPRNLERQFGRMSFAQEAEDLMLFREMGADSTRKGFYVDVGAHHPIRFSNTYFFYKMGWHGVNIDAMPGSMSEFRRLRPRDINLEIGIGLKASTECFFVHHEPALNTFDKELSESRGGLKSVVPIQIRTLGDVLNEFVQPLSKIDFLSVDAEGFDEQVLRSNDWSKFRPRFVVAESLGNAINSTLVSCPLCRFLNSEGYKLICVTGRSRIFVEN